MFPAYKSAATVSTDYQSSFQKDSGWPEALRVVAAEAWRRAGVGELADEELYPADAAWAGVCDRMAHPPEEAVGRRGGRRG